MTTDSKKDAFGPPAKQWGCQCGPSPTSPSPETSCICGRNPLMSGTWELRPVRDDGRLRFARPILTASRFLEVRGPGGAVIGGVLPIRACDVGALGGRWVLELAVSLQTSSPELWLSSPEVWFSGHGYRLIRSVDDAPWLSLVTRHIPLRLADEVVQLSILEAFENRRGEPMEFLVARISRT